MVFQTHTHASKKLNSWASHGKPKIMVWEMRCCWEVRRGPHIPHGIQLHIGEGSHASCSGVPRQLFKETSRIRCLIHSTQKIKITSFKNTTSTEHEIPPTGPGEELWTLYNATLSTRYPWEIPLGYFFQEPQLRWHPSTAKQVPFLGG